MKKPMKFSTEHTEKSIVICFMIISAVLVFFTIMLHELTYSYTPVVGTPYVPETQTVIKEIVPENMIVNINTASFEELMTLDGIGEVMAQKIIEYRETNNGFLTVDELMKVDGIGEAKFEKIKNFITIQ